VATLQGLLTARGLRENLQLLTGAVSDQPVDGLTVLEDLSQIRTARPHTLAIATRAASEKLAYYKLDMAIRVAASKSVPAILFVGTPPPAVSPTGRELSNRTGPVLLAAPSLTLSELMLPIAREIEGDTASGLQRLFDLSQRLGAMTAELAPIDALVRTAEAITERTITIDPADQSDAITIPVSVEDRTEMKLTAPRTWERTKDRETAIALQLLADAVARVIASTRRKEGIPMSSRSELLTQLLTVDDAQREALLRRARAIGIPVDGWHVVASIDFENLLAIADHDEIAAYELREEIIRQALGSLRTGERIWHRARLGLATLLVHTWRHDPGPLAARDVARAIERMLRHTITQRPGLLMRSGIGSVHPGPQGLRASALEAQAGLSEARLRNLTNRPMLFDATSIRRGLIEWYASDTAREAARRLLAPLDDLTTGERDKAVRTLAAYLDAGGSVGKAADTLFLHRNAVTYRLKRAVKLLGVELEDPEQRLMLHLACRAELLQPAESRRR
jgi:sugar diacid utilization regulator